MTGLASEAYKQTKNQNIQMKMKHAVVTLLVGTAMAAGALALADENIAMHKLPAAVQNTLKQIVGGNHLEGCDSEVANGTTVYEADFKSKGSECSVTVSEAGEVLEWSLDAPLNIVPPPVLKAALNAHPGGKIGESEIHNKGSRLFYVLEVRTDNSAYDVSLDAAGKVIADEKDTD